MQIFKTKRTIHQSSTLRKQDNAAVFLMIFLPLVCGALITRICGLQSDLSFAVFSAANCLFILVASLICTSEDAELLVPTLAFVFGVFFSCRGPSDAKELIEVLISFPCFFLLERNAVKGSINRHKHKWLLWPFIIFLIASFTVLKLSLL